MSKNVETNVEATEVLFAYQCTECDFGFRTNVRMDKCPNCDEDLLVESFKGTLTVKIIEDNTSLEEKE